MDKTIENWTAKGWTLTNTTPAGRDRYLLTFEYIPTEAEIAKEKSDQRRGCLTLVVLLLVCGGIYALQRGSVETSQRATSTGQAVRLATTRTQASIDRATQLVFEPTTAAVRATEIALTPSATNSRTPTPTQTEHPTSTDIPSPTPIYAEVNSEGINARSCPSTDCDIVRTVSQEVQISILGSADDWYWVEFSGGETAYIRSDLLILPDEAEVAVAPTLTATDTPRPTRTPRPTVVSRPVDTSASDNEDARLISDALFILAGGRNIEIVQVANGRPNGGERTVIIAYLTTETTDVGFVDEIIDIYQAVAVAIETNEIDVDSVSLLAGDAVGTVVVSIDDLLAYHQGRITRSQFINRWQTTAF